MMIYVKTLSGDTLALSCPLGTTRNDLPFLVHDALGQDQSVDLHHLRLIPDEAEEAEEGKGVHDGQVFYLLVEDPQIRVCLYREDEARMTEPFDHPGNEEDEEEKELIQLLDVYLLRVLHTVQGEEEILYQHLFYTPVAYVATNAGEEEDGDGWSKRYSNVYYHEEDIDVLYNPSAEARAQYIAGAIGMGNYRDIDLRPGATAHYRPTDFASRSPIPSYESAIRHEIDRIWMEHVRKTGEAELYPIQRLYSISD